MTTSLKNTISTWRENRHFDQDGNPVECEKCGTHLSKTPNDGPRCWPCYIAEEDRKNAMIAVQNHAKMKAKRMFDSEFTNPKLARATFENYKPQPNYREQQEKIKEYCMRYAKNFNKDKPVSLMLQGKYGVGKSHLLSAAGKVIENNHGITFIAVSMPKLFTLIKNSFDKKGKYSEAELLQLIADADLLLLDDIGAEISKAKPKDKRSDEEEEEFSWAKTKAFEIFDSRVGKHNLYTSNFDNAKLLQHYGEREFSRMMEDTYSYILPGDNYRLLQQGEKS